MAYDTGCSPDRDMGVIMPPRDSDGFTEDELAQVIPLRRRERERPDRDQCESEPVGVFESPEEPEPAGE
jgi:hypothetical protein